MKKKPTECYGGKIKNLAETIADIVIKNPDAYRGEPGKEYLHATLRTIFPDYGKRDTCFNCGRSMRITIYTADIADAILILSMAREVKRNLAEGKIFTEANKVYMPGLHVKNSILKRQTKCDYLGLVKQPDELKNSGYWVLTKWAWDVLGGTPIPKEAHYWEGKLQKRSEETTTLSEMFKTHNDILRKAAILHRASRTDYSREIGDYNPSEWSTFGGYIQDVSRLQTLKI